MVVSIELKIIICEQVTSITTDRILVLIIQDQAYQLELDLIMPPFWLCYVTSPIPYSGGWEAKRETENLSQC